MAQATVRSLSGLLHDLTNEEVLTLTDSNYRRALKRFLACVVATKTADEYVVIVDYSKTLKEMIADGDYGSVHSDITAEHFPLTGEGEVKKKLALVHFGRFMSMSEVDELVAASGKGLAKIEHLLAFGAKYPDLQCEFPIIALGSNWRSDVPCLSFDGQNTTLDLSSGMCDDGETFYDFCRFLVVSNK